MFKLMKQKIFYGIKVVEVFENMLFQQSLDDYQNYLRIYSYKFFLNVNCLDLVFNRESQWEYVVDVFQDIYLL